MKKVRFFDATTTILQGIGFLLIGIFILIDRETFLNLIVHGISITLVLIALINSVKNIIIKENKAIFVNFLSSIANILAGAFIWYKPNLFISIFPLLFTAYLFIDAIIKTTIFVLYKRNNIEGRFAILIRSIITYIFSIIMLFYPFIRDTITFLLAAIYCILLSITYIVSAVESYIPIKKMNKIKKKIKIALPIFIAAFIPYRVLKEINEAFKPYRKNKIVEIEKENIEPDIEVLVHLKKGLIASFGHVDLYYNGKVISYGSYDEANVILSSSIGDGVLFECDKEKTETSK